MANYKAGAGKLISLASHEAAGTEAELTIPLTNITNNKYSKIIINWEMQTTATFALEMILNADATGYGYTLVYTNGTVNAWTTATAATEFLIFDTTLNPSGQYLNGTIEIQLTDIASANKQIYSIAMRNQFRQISSGFNADNAALTEIKITTSTSTWAIGSKFKVYGVLR